MAYIRNAPWRLLSITFILVLWLEVGGMQSRPEAGVEVLYRHRRKLVGDRTAKSRLGVVRASDY